MNKKIYLLLTVLLAWSFNLKAQTAQIESLTANPGAPVSFDITVGDMPANVGAVSLFIGYDPNVLTFTGSTLVDADFGGYVINNMAASHQVGIQWTSTNPGQLDGVLLSLEFQYNNLGGSCAVTFNPGCEFADLDLNSIIVSYINGGIDPNPDLATITIDESSFPAGPVSFGVTGNGFTADAGAVTLYIEFDASMLQFSGFSTTLTGLLVNGDNVNGLVSVAYTNTDGESINQTFLTLNFNYDGTGTSELVFTGACEVAYTDLTSPAVSFDNGSVSPESSSYQMWIEDKVTEPGNAIGINVYASGFDADYLMGAVTLHIGFNPAHLTFSGITDGTLTGASAYVMGPGVIGITWTDNQGVTIDGTLLTLNFDYHFGASELTFEGGCEIADINLSLIPTTFTDGSISPVLGGPSISLPTLTGVVGQAIDFPITAQNFIMDPAAISLFIGYDNTVLSYTGSTEGTLTGYFINEMPNSHIGIQWSDFNGVDIDPNNNDVILTLHFIYNGGVSDLIFDAGCEFAQTDLSIIPVSYFDGAVVLGSFFNLKAYLEGPFNGTTMNSGMNAGGYIPLAQPYNIAPWNYAGTENVPSIPNANVIDWIMIEFRETAGAANTATYDSLAYRTAAFILNDGHVVALDGSSNLLIPITFNANVYVVIYHRNHIGMMSSVPVVKVGDVYTYDFTTAQSQAYLSGQKALTSGGFAMYAGDGNGDGQISNVDLFNIWMVEVGLLGYYGGDFDLNSFVQNVDLFNYWMINVGNGTQIP